MKTIKTVSSRTAQKILKRMNIGCSKCGWKEAACDLHHIIPRSKGGTNDHENLTLLCPNCHRMAHSNLITNFVSFKEQVGEEWKKFYYTVSDGPRIARSMKQKKEEDRKKLEQLKASDIDFSAWGWKAKAAKIIGTEPQTVARWLRREDPEFLNQCRNW